MNSLKVGKLENIPITEKAFNCLQQLLATGLYGSSDGEVAQRLIDEGIQRSIKAGVIHSGELYSQPQLSCPNCSSPKVEKNETMGPYDYSCMDCLNGFNA